MLDTATQAQIILLKRRIDDLYKAAKHRPSQRTCDICGAGDTQGKNALYKIREVVHGYSHRPGASPHLCHRHGTGWALSFNAFNPLHKQSDEAIDLHFALYLANQLTKEKLRCLTFNPS